MIITRLWTPIVIIVRRIIETNVFNGLQKVPKRGYIGLCKSVLRPSVEVFSFWIQHYHVDSAIILRDVTSPVIALGSGKKSSNTITQLTDPWSAYKATAEREREYGSAKEIFPNERYQRVN